MGLRAGWVAVLTLALSSYAGPSVAAPSDPERPGVEAPFRIATFNALGASHTDLRGSRPPERRRFAAGVVRTDQAIRYFALHKLDVIATQEFQKPQRKRFRLRAGHVFGMFAGPRPGGPNAVIWRRSKFAFISAYRLTVPYFNGRPTVMPVVNLRDRRSGQVITVISTHHPADVGGPARWWRMVATRVERRYVARLVDGRHPRPVFLLGDMNEKSEFFCRATRFQVLVAASGGLHQKRVCTPPRKRQIDWLMGTRGVHFSHYRVDGRTQRARVSDHPLVWARVSPAR